MTLRTFSYGGGVQSTAALVLAAERRIDFPIFLFCNVGDDSEHPATLAYVANVAKPYAAAHGIELYELRHMRKDGEEETLYKKLTRPNSRSTGIPIRLEDSGAPSVRSCTVQFKIRRMGVWQRRHGATRAAPAITGLGISLDEFQRMRTTSSIETQTLTYPLIDMRLTRQDCMNIITRAGLAVPPKSSCWFCPFHRIPAWQKLKRETPELFDRAVALEKTLSERSEGLGNGKLFMLRKMIPLDRGVADQSDMFADDDNCESGFCMT
jgi:hypothetical protein